MMKAQFEKVSSPLEGSFKGFIYENENFDAPWHFHPEYELTYIVKGKGIRYVGNSIQKFDEGDFVLLGSNLPHCWKNAFFINESVKSIVFQWDDAVLGEGWLNKNEFQNIKKLLSNASKGIKFNDSVSIKYYKKLTKILKESSLEKLLSLIKLLEELAFVKEFDTLTSDNFSASLNFKTNKRIDRVYDYVREHYRRKIKLREVSSLVEMGDEAFCRFFKKSLNKSFSTFINEYRINVASKMLIETSMQVSQIAYECGYESLPFFYRQFRKFMNCSPLVFKKKFLEADI